jgi:hypothetical protein
MSTLKVTNIQATGETASRSVSGVAAAWVNFNGTGTIAVNDSVNVASLTDNGTGDYAVNFSNNFDAANYAAVAGSQSTSLTSPRVTWAPRICNLLVGSFNVSGVPENTTSGSVVDVLELRCLTHGDLA